MEVDAERALAPGIAHGLPAGVEPGWALVGGVGEYELLFAVPQDERVEGATRIGCGGFRARCDAEIRIVSGEKSGRMSAPPPDYRAITRENWLAATATYWRLLGL